MAIEQQGRFRIAELERLSHPVFQAAVLHTGPLPLERQRSAELCRVLMAWLDEVGTAPQTQPALWLQGPALYRPEDMNAVAAHGRQWMPELGLGIRPLGDPPRMLNAADLNRLRWDQAPKPMHETAFYLAKGADAAKTAMPLFCGTGAILYCLLNASAETYLREQRQIWLPTIKDPAFQAHPFYVPFLSRHCLEPVYSGSLGVWMGRAVLYLRESPEDEGMLLVTSLPSAIDRLQERLFDSNARFNGWRAPE